MALDLTCSGCGSTFEAKSARAKWCSERCRKQRQRSGAPAEVVDLPAAEPASEVEALGPVEAMTRLELVEAGRLDSVIGQTCLALARRLDSPRADTGSAMSSVAARLDELLTKAKRAGKSVTAPDKLRDELSERRAQRGA